MMAFNGKPLTGLKGERAPGVVNRNGSVITKMPLAARLPYPETRGSHRLRAMSRPVVTSRTPNKNEVPRKPRIGYNHARTGLFATNGRMPAASKAKNLKDPNVRRKNTKP